MAGSASTYWAPQVLGNSLGLSSISVPATLFVALSLVGFDSTVTGSNVNEVSAADYARLELANDSSTWSTPTNAVPSVASNDNDISWPAAQNDWGTPYAIYLCDASTGGNILYGSDITNAQDIATGDVFKILAGTFVFNGF